MSEQLTRSAPPSWSVAGCGATVAAIGAVAYGLAEILTNASSTAVVGLVSLAPFVAFVAAVGAVIGHVLDAVAAHVVAGEASVRPQAIAALGLLAALLGAWFGWPRSA